MNIEQFVSVEFAAAMMMVNPETVRRWIRAGKLPAFRAGRRGSWRIPLAALNAAYNQEMLKGL